MAISREESALSRDRLCLGVELTVGVELKVGVEAHGGQCCRLSIERGKMAACSGPVATVFISYRRDDTQQACGRIRERLVDQYGSDAVFLDFENIGYGWQFLQEIERAISQSDVFLLIIGSRWLDQSNKARLSQTTDVVRLEIETALRLGLSIVPVLIDRTSFPTREQLPETLHPILGSANAA